MSRLAAWPKTHAEVHRPLGFRKASLCDLTNVAAAQELSGQSDSESGPPPGDPRTGSSAVCTLARWKTGLPLVVA